MPSLRKFTIHLDPADVAVLKKAYPQQGYSQAIRAVVHKLAKAIEQKLTDEQEPRR